MSGQPVSGSKWTAVSGGVGTVVVTPNPAVLRRVIWGGSYVGTLNIHDASEAAGTTATSQVVSFPIPATTYPQVVEINAQLRNGLVYQATGTPVVTLIWN